MQSSFGATQCDFADQYPYEISNVQAKGRLQCWDADGQELGGSCREGCAGKGQAATPGAAKADGLARWKLPQGNWMVLGVLGVLEV